MRENYMHVDLNSKEQKRFLFRTREQEFARQVLRIEGIRSLKRLQQDFERD